MPKVPTLTTGVSNAAFTVPRNAVGFMVWSEQAEPLRVRFGAACDAGDAHLGFLIPPASATDVKGFTRMFVRDRDMQGKGANKDTVYIYQASGGNITSGVGYEIFMH
jgi:hypothetical protein